MHGASAGIPNCTLDLEKPQVLEEMRWSNITKLYGYDIDHNFSTGQDTLFFIRTFLTIGPDFNLQNGTSFVSHEPSLMALAPMSLL